MKLFKNFLLFLAIFLSTNTIAPLNGADAGPGAGAGFDFSDFGSGAGAGGLMAPPTEEELKQIEEFLQTLSEDELKELADIGKQIMDTAEQQGVPVFGPGAGAQPEPKPAKKPTERKPEKKEVKPTPKEESSALKFKKIITRLIEVITAIRKKTATEEEFSDEISVFDKNLNNLVYYLHVIDDEKILKNILEKEFDGLRTTIETLTNNLEKYNNNFNIPTSVLLEFESSKDRKEHAKQLQAAQDVFDSITALFTKAFTQDLINEELEKVLKKYEPEALKIKQEEEEKQKKAKEFTKKIENSPTNSNRGSNYYSPYSSDYYASLNAQPIPGVPSNLKITDTKKELPKQPELNNKLLASNNKPSKSSPEDTKNSTKKESKKNASTSPAMTIADLEKSIPYYLADVEDFLNPKYNTVISFIDGYKQSPSEGPLSPTLRELTFRLDKAKKEVGKWVALLDKETNFSQFNTSKQKMKDILADEKYFPTIKELHQKTKKTSNLKDNLKHFHSMMNFIEDKCC